MTLRLALLPLLAGCLRDVETPFPDGVEPWEENTAPAPEPTADEEYPEEVVLVTGQVDEYRWLHGRGYVHGDVARAWMAVQDPAVVVDRRGLDAWTVTWDVEEGFDVSFAVDQEVHDILTIAWRTVWRQAVVEGDAEKPELVGVRFQKTEGSAILELMRGSIVLRATDDPDRTEIELIEHIEAPATNDEDLRCYMQDLFDEVVITVRGEALPEYTERCR